ncbi:MAG TPA: amphi-Trp domain-containing protein [Solirubrobacterales bacterium]|jgi:amphi-Trp domain-containing protein
MSSFEVERKEKVTRKEAATRLRRIANLLAGEGEEVKFERGGMQFELTVPEELEMKVELELDGKESEIEIELTW